MKRFASIVAAGGVALGAAGALGARAATTNTPGAGIIHVYLAGSLGASSQAIVITGAFGDAGRFTEAAPKSKVVLSKGSLTVDDSKGATRESDLFAHLSSIVNPTTCALSVSYTASATLKDGTGAYRGITGAVQVNTTDAGVFPRLASGKCNLANSATPIGFVSLAQGSGRVSFK
ncbi:MAG: hypothetical protein ABSD82_14670 [Solirubrobacteraceae bacterium]|jgi:hypothetical protein